jgi:hypothetical protein
MVPNLVGFVLRTVPCASTGDRPARPPCAVCQALIQLLALMDSWKLCNLIRQSLSASCATHVDSEAQRA